MTVETMLNIPMKPTGFMTYAYDDDTNKLVEDGYLGRDELSTSVADFLEKDARKDGFCSRPMLLEAVVDTEDDTGTTAEKCRRRIAANSALIDYLTEQNDWCRSEIAKLGDA